MRIPPFVIVHTEVLTHIHTHMHAEGSHTLSKTVVTSSGGFGMLSKFTKKKSSCIGCRAVLDNDGKLIDSSNDSHPS